MSKPFLRMAELKLPAPVPESPSQVAMIARQMVIEDVVKGRVTYLLLLTFKGATARLWQLHHVPAPDDVVRHLIQRDQPEAIAFVFATPLPPEVEGERGYTVAVEAAAGKYDTLIALAGGPGPGGERVRLYERNLPEAKHQWLGVEPDGQLEMWVEGVVGAIGPQGEA